VVAAADGALMNLVSVGRVLDLPLVSFCRAYTNSTSLEMEINFKERTNPKVYVQVSTAAKLAVADLESDCHLVVRVQLLVEAFARVRLELNVVRRADGE
jgi:hypothetical protein